MPSSIYPSSSYDLMKQLCPTSETTTVSFHPHPLRLKNAHETPYYCVGCKEKGLGNCYRCEEEGENCVDYHLHQKCCDLSESCYSSIKFTFLKNKKCDFVFQKELAAGNGTGKRGCDACGKEVKGWFYKCKICKKKPHYLHPCCAHLPIKLQKGEIVLYLKAKTSSTCQGCNRENINVALGVRGWFYVSNCGKHCYHVGCVMDMAMENLNKYDDDDDDDRYHIEETTGDDHGRKSCSCESLTRANSGAITKRSPKVGMKKFLTGAATIVINLIISAIFGIPLTDACVAFYHLF